jgi:hypothetical protein
MSQVEIGKGRVHQQGRSTDGWRKGEKVTSLDQLRKGTVLIAVSHQFRAENLVQIVLSPSFPFNRDIVHWVYVSPDLKQIDGESKALWSFELGGDGNEWFIAARE